MLKSRYSNILTIILIVILVLIIGIFSVLGVRWYHKIEDKRANENKIKEIEQNNQNPLENEENTDINTDVNTTGNLEIPELTNINSNTVGTTHRPRKKKVKTEEGFVVLGYIEIPKTNLKKCLIFESTSIKELEKGVGVVYPSPAFLNTKGNVVIQGHNYRNNMFFSNNHKLKIGDKIKITDSGNKTMVYTIYKIYETTPEDSSHFTRDTGDNIEISLSTCTKSANKILVIWAKV